MIALVVLKCPMHSLLLTRRPISPAVKVLAIISVSHARESGLHLHQRQVAADSVPISHHTVCFLEPRWSLPTVTGWVRWEANSEVKTIVQGVH